MSFKLIVAPEAEGDIAQAAAWYEERVESLGAVFLREVEATIELVRDNPYQCQVVFDDVRRAMLKRFPYGVMYVASEGEVIIAACFHCSRHPRRWQSRTTRR